LAYEWDPVSLTRNQIYWTLIRTRPKTKSNWGKKDAAKECLKPEESIRAK
jgi:hypothetical protein